MRELLGAFGRELDAAACNAQRLRMPASLPARLLELGEWSAEQALASVDRPPIGPPALALVELAPLLSAAEALATLARKCQRWDAHEDIAGDLALARRVVSLGEPAAALAAVAGLEAGPRGLVLARLAADLPAELRASAAEQALVALGEREGDAACIAILALARALPQRRAELVERALKALWRGDDGVYPYVLRWLVYAGAGPRARELALAETMTYPRAQALAAVLPDCPGEERGALWRAWREAIDSELAGRSWFVSLRVPVPASPDELSELLTLLRARRSVHERSVALAHVALHHGEHLDEAIEVLRMQSEPIERALGLLYLLPARPDLAREVLAALAEQSRRSVNFHKTSLEPWQAPASEPPVGFMGPTQSLADLQARALVGLAPAERCAEALKLLAGARRLSDEHALAGAISALASGLDSAAREHALTRARVLAQAGDQPFIGLSQVLRRLPIAKRPALAKLALASLGQYEEPDTLALPPVIAALPAELAGAQVLRVLRAGGSWVVPEIAAIVAAGLRAGAVVVIADELLAASTDRHRYFIHLLLPHADAGLRPRVVGAVLAASDGSIDLAACVPALTDDELRALIAGISSEETRMSKQHAHRSLTISRLVRPLAQRGALELLRPALASLGRADRLPALVTALDLLAPDERSTVSRQLIGDLRRGGAGVATVHVEQLAAAGHAEALLELPALGLASLAALAPGLPAALQPRLRERLVAAVEAIHTARQLDDLVPLHASLAGDVLSQVVLRCIKEAAQRGRTALYAALAGDEAGYAEAETGLTRLLLHLADPLAWIAELEASALRNT